ncbi:MAG: S8 family serine peptidase, partial [Bacteriovorax sp.]|nr:S8 family serine peptidase [Bacteriovorax sp.]
SQVLAGVNWVTNRKLTTPSRPMVANVSLGGNEGTSAYNSLDYGIRNSIAAGVVYAIVAGNSSANAVYFSPAHTVEALTIGAYSASSNTWASFSNYGSIIDVLAPGVNVLSTYKGSTTAIMSGTSMATPHVVGAAALYLSTHPGSTPAQVRAALLGASTNPIPGPNPVIRGVRSGTTNKSVYMGNF